MESYKDTTEAQGSLVAPESFVHINVPGSSGAVHQAQH